MFNMLAWRQAFQRRFNRTPTEFEARRGRRTARWVAALRKSGQARTPPRHIAAAMGWKYVREKRTGMVLHVPRSA